MPAAVKRRDNVHCDSCPGLWRLLCWSLMLTGGAFTVTFAGGAYTVTRDAGESVRFSEHLLVNEHRYTFGIATVDIDGDGDLDLTYPDVYPDKSTFYWLENNGQGNFQRHVIYKDERGWMERHATGDINGDGRQDVAMVDNRFGRLFWFANPDQPADGRVIQGWSRGGTAEDALNDLVSRAGLEQSHYN